MWKLCMNAKHADKDLCLRVNTTRTTEVNLKMQGFVCFKANCGQRLKCESELNSHLKAHTSKPIKCEYRDYKNTDKRNVEAHM